MTSELTLYHTMSPCRGRCDIDNQTLTCKGCGRTLEEISMWTTLSPMEKSVINQRVRGKQFAYIEEEASADYGSGQQKRAEKGGAA